MKKTIIIGLSVFLLAMASMAFAAEMENSQENELKREEIRNQKIEAKEERQELRLEKREEREQAMKQKREKRCANIQNKIQERVGNFDSLKNKHMAVYTNMQSRIQKFIDRLKGDGYDVSKIESDLKTLQEKIQKFSVDYKAYLVILGEAKTFKCGETDANATGEVKTKMQAVRASLKTVHQDAMDIRNFMQTTVMSDIRALRNQKVVEKKTESKKSLENETASDAGVVENEL